MQSGQFFCLCILHLKFSYVCTSLHLSKYSTAEAIHLSIKSETNNFEKLILDKIGAYKTPVKMDFKVTAWTVNCVISGFKFTSFSCKKPAYFGSA